MITPGPEGIKVGDVYLAGDGNRWAFTAYNDYTGVPLAFNRNGEPVTARDLITVSGWRYQLPQYQVPVELKGWGDLGPQLGTAESWPREPGGPADVWDVYAVSPELRRAWLVHAGLHWFDTGRQRWNPWRYVESKRPSLAVVHAEHVTALARLTLWYEGHQRAMGQLPDTEGQPQ